MSWFIEALKKYAVFSGRARRKEYWNFALFVGIIYIVLLVIALASKQTALLGLAGAFYLGVLIPSLAVGVRRLHDTGRSGWWLLFGIVPIAGAITLLVFACSDSTPGPNQYGPNPKEDALTYAAV
ncbi:DUF805 domain-containing protein [Streptomyces pseudovenezuelae]|uniref:Uncharacterized membrane protein YhaH (DUF805 family) n=1 Tax=Streptomyces pseudovenezuelae TaxID=67350 RepID=A0ABT6M241_9ACTN|nr:DUF805 domain-containing protein [Streptomyces pseudovenezuelae]MDH6222616.1 uncharacterized membrane protein YhaH (DUF805 family) [Streptomyces pseudovenezuelae]